MLVTLKHNALPRHRGMNTIDDRGHDVFRDVCDTDSFLIKLSYFESTMLLNGAICVSVQLYTRTYRDTLLRRFIDTRRGALESTDRPFCPYNIVIATSIYVNPNCWPLETYQSLQVLIPTIKGHEYCRCH